jgi:hypothetical protein
VCSGRRNDERDRGHRVLSRLRGISGTFTMATLVHDVTGGEIAPDLSDDLWRGEG